MCQPEFLCSGSDSWLGTQIKNYIDIEKSSITDQNFYIVYIDNLRQH